jgi:hypothetical protein
VLKAREGKEKRDQACAGPARADSRPSDGWDKQVSTFAICFGCFITLVCEDEQYTSGSMKLLFFMNVNS